MTDDRTKKGPEDSSRVNTSEDYEVAYWTTKFGVSAEELKTAVQAVGSSASAVENHLRKRASKR